MSRRKQTNPKSCKGDPSEPLDPMRAQQEVSSDAENVNDAKVKMEPGIYLCSECGQTFDNQTEIDEHSSSCGQEPESQSPPSSPHGSANGELITNGISPYPFHCSLCGIGVPDVGALQMHTLQAHSVQDIQNSRSPYQSLGQDEEKSYACDVCHKAFDSILAMHNHKRSQCPGPASSPQVTTCEVCKVQLEPGVTLADHEPDCRRARIPCPVCNELFVEFSALETHAITEHFLAREVKFVCRACGKSYETSDELQKHLLDTHVLHVFKCNLCDQLFDTSVDIQVHFSVSHAHQVENFPCKSCNDPNIVFENEEGLRLHVTLFHLGGQNPLVPKPGNGFPKMPDLIRWCDQQETSGCRAFACKLCPESFDVEFLYERHMESAHAAQLFNQYSSPDWIYGAKKARMEEKPLYLGTQAERSKCSICDRVCESSCELAEHRLSHCRVTKSDMCAVCRKVLTSLEDFFVHSHEHNGQGNGQSCIICKQSLTTTIELHFHGKFHLNQNSPVCSPAEVVKSENPHASVSPDRGSNPLPYQCIKCQACFGSEAEIRAHVATHMLTEGVNHHCHLCSQVFDSPSKLQCHLIDHSFPGRSEYECCICGSVFTRAHGLQQHIFMHPFEERPYACTINDCGQRYFFRSELENHEMSDHTDHCAELKQKSFTCGNCDKRFPSLELVAVHRRFCGDPSAAKGFDWAKVEGGSAFPCAQCAKTFSSLSALQGHSHVHMSGRSPHQCAKCDKTFASATKLRNHLRTHNRDFEENKSANLHTCSVCPKSFSRKDNLKAHMKSHNRDSPITPDGMFTNGLPTLVPQRSCVATSPNTATDPSPLSSTCDEL